MLTLADDKQAVYKAEQMEAEDEETTPTFSGHTPYNEIQLK